MLLESNSKAVEKNKNFSVLPKPLGGYANLIVIYNNKNIP
jgi:hypothetical protein